MELRQLTIFCAAAETLNFTKAADNLGYAQSNITGQIRLLEKELGIKLFERLGRGIKITNEGKIFYENAKHIIDLCKKAKGQFSNDQYYGILNIGAAETICVYYLPKVLKKYKELYPQVEIRIQTDSCEFFPDYIRANNIDIAMVLTDTIDIHDMIVRKWRDEEMMIVASPNHPFAQLENPSIKNLADECLIITLPGCGYRPLILSMLKAQGIMLSSTMELSSVASIKQCTIAGLGLAIMPKIAVKDDIARGTLKGYEINVPELVVKSLFVYHSKKWVTPAMKAFLELCYQVEIG